MLSAATTCGPDQGLYQRLFWVDFLLPSLHAFSRMHNNNPLLRTSPQPLTLTVTLAPVLSVMSISMSVNLISLAM